MHIIGIVNCLINNGGCAQVCTDTNTTYHYFGFNLNSDGRTCTDVNECTVNSITAWAKALASMTMDPSIVSAIRVSQ
jgi:hypothetical protein